MTTIAVKSYFRDILRFVCVFRWMLMLLTLPTAAKAQDYTFTTNNGTITITRYTGPGGAVSLPTAINGMPVTSIGNSAFQNLSSLTDIIIPDSVTNIGVGAFLYSASLTAITVESLNPGYSSVGGVL